MLKNFVFSDFKGMARLRLPQQGVFSLRRFNSMPGSSAPVRSRIPPTPPPFRKHSSSGNAQQDVWEFDQSTNGSGYENAGYSWIPPLVEFGEGGIIQNSDAVAEILSQPMLIIERRLELMNVFLGFEQANRYAILDTEGNPLGFMEEEDFGIGKAIMRQIYRLHRPFKVNVYNKYGNHILTIRRPFSFINSHIKAILPSSHESNSIVLGETKQQWHPWRRKYNLFLKTGEDEYDQFGKVDAPFLSFAFPMHDSHGKVIGAVDRNWVGLGREMFTDTGVYMLRMEPSTLIQVEDPSNLSTEPLTLDQRAILLGTAISIDFDYFSRHSGRGGFVSFGDYE